MAAPPPSLLVTEITAAALPDRLDALAGLLEACVRDGASIGFVLPFGPAEAAAYWEGKVAPGLRGGRLLLLAAELEGRLAGTVQLDCDTPGNQPHRAEVRKLLVHPDCRRRGLARLLMAEVERRAADRGRSLLTLDTRSGDAAEPLYASLGYATVGMIPGYCLDTLGERLDATTVMYKRL